MDREPHKLQRTVILEDEALRSLQGFTQLPNAVLKHPTLSFGAKVAYGVLLSYAWQDDFCWPAQERLGQDMNCSVRQVRRLLVELKAAGSVYWQQQGLNRPNIYVLRSLSAWVPPNVLKNKERTDLSAPDRTWMSVQDRPYTSDKEYSLKKIQEDVNVDLNDPIRTEEDDGRLEALVLEMLDVLGDRHSAGFYRRVAGTVPSEVIFQLLSETKEKSARREIRSSRGAYFTDAVARYCRENGYNLGLPMREAA
jgi:hypothetical protein